MLLEVLPAYTESRKPKMPNTYLLIAKTTLASPTSVITFSGIPATYTDLCLKLSVRGTTGGTFNEYIEIRVNGDTGSNYARTLLYTDDGTTIKSFRNASAAYVYVAGVPSAGNTSNTFANAEYYIPNYNSSNMKPMAISHVGDANTTASYLIQQAGQWVGTSAITSISLTGNSFAANSSFYLYGIKNS